MIYVGRGEKCFALNVLWSGAHCFKCSKTRHLFQQKMDLLFSYVNEAQTSETVIPHRRKSCVLNPNQTVALCRITRAARYTHAPHKAAAIEADF